MDGKRSRGAFRLDRLELYRILTTTKLEKIRSSSANPSSDPAYLATYVLACSMIDIATNATFMTCLCAYIRSLH
jgi:hypothetical protein